jgi:hypothetical protein
VGGDDASLKGDEENSWMEALHELGRITAKNKFKEDI